MASPYYTGEFDWSVGECVDLMGEDFPNRGYCDGCGEWKRLSDHWLCPVCDFESATIRSECDPVAEGM